MRHSINRRGDYMKKFLLSGMALILIAVAGFSVSSYLNCPCAGTCACSPCACNK